MTGSGPARGFGIDQLPVFERGPRAGWVVGAASLLGGGLAVGLAFTAGGVALLLLLPALPLVALGLYAVAVASSHVIVSRDRLTVRNLLHQVDVSVGGVRSLTWGPLPWTGPLARVPGALGLRREAGSATFVDGRVVPLLATSVVRRGRSATGVADEPGGGRATFDRLDAAWRFARSLHR